MLHIVTIVVLYRKISLRPCCVSLFDEETFIFPVVDMDYIMLVQVESVTHELYTGGNTSCIVSVIFVFFFFC